VVRIFSSSKRKPDRIIALSVDRVLESRLSRAVIQAGFSDQKRPGDNPITIVRKSCLISRPEAGQKPV